MCPPSARLCENVEDEPSVFAEEGTQAHSLCEYKVNKAFGIPTEDPTPNLSFHNEEMEGCAEEYASYVLEVFQEHKAEGKDPLILTE